MWNICDYLICKYLISTFLAAAFSQIKKKLCLGYSPKFTGEAMIFFRFSGKKYNSMHYERHFCCGKKNNVCLPYLKFSDLLLKTHFFIWPYHSQPN